MSQYSSKEYGLEGFRNFIINQIKFYREELKADDTQVESAFYSDLKVICEEFYSDLKLSSENIQKEINTIADTTRELIKKRHCAVEQKLNEAKMGETKEVIKALPKEK